MAIRHSRGKKHKTKRERKWEEDKRRGVEQKTERSKRIVERGSKKQVINVTREAKDRRIAEGRPETN